MNSQYEIIGIVLVKNEDIFIESAVTNILGFCDKVIIADNCSTDNTTEILGRLAAQSPKIQYHLINELSESHDLISGYAGKKVWIFAVDGDEIYDPAGLAMFRQELLEGTHDNWWMIFGNVLNCTELDRPEQTASGYLAPPCRSMTKLYNFGLIESWTESSGERLHGGEVCFKKGYDKSLRHSLHETVSWDEAKLRCLHMCFLQRSSRQKMKDGAYLPRPNPADIMSRNIFQRSLAAVKELFGVPVAGKTEWKMEKFTRGENVSKNVAAFFSTVDKKTFSHDIL